MENGDFNITINSLCLEQDCSPVGNYVNGEIELESLPKGGQNKEHGQGKEKLKEADGVKLDVPEDTVETDAESSMAAQKQLTKEGGEIEEIHIDWMMSSESQETDSGKGKEKVDESNVVQIIITRDNAKGKEKVIEANMVQIIIARDKDNGEEHPETPETTRESVPENGHDQDNGKRKEKVNEAIVVQIIINWDNGKEKANETYEKKQDVVSDRCPAKITRESPLSELEMSTGKGKEQVKKADDVKLDVAIDTENEHLLDEIKGEYEAGARMTTENMFPGQDRVYKYARSMVERAKGKCALYKVHSGLRDVSAKHYEPVFVSIGPYHHRGNTQLQDMEEHKEHYLQVLLRRVKENNYERYVEALKNEKGEPQALHCYRGSHQMMKLQDSFGECMVRDGCFIVELFRRNANPDEYEDFRNDKLFNMDWMRPSLICDMILFENQIPLFVLRALFALTEKRPYTDEDFAKLALNFFSFNGGWIPHDEIEIGRLDDIPHLLGLVYEAVVVSKRKANLEQETPKQQNSRPSKSLLEYLINLWSRFVRIRKASVPGTPEQPCNRWRQSWEPIWTAVALQQVGITFVKANDNAAFYDISFIGGQLSIPMLVIEDNTECFFRSLVAYEQYSKNRCLHRVVDYLYVMDCLINSSKDVELLRHCGIIDNIVGDDEKVSTIINRLFSYVYFDQETFFYKETFRGVNEFCKNPSNVWIAKLKTRYFSSPWSVISLLAAVLLLLLTATQTMYAVLSYHHPKS